MKIKVLLDGKEYVSKDEEEATAKEISDNHYAIASKNTGPMRMQLDTGEWMVLGPELCKLAVFFYIY